MTNPFQLDYRDGSLVIMWRGERIGYLEQRGDTCVSGCAIFGDHVFDCDDYSQDGIPLDWVSEKVTEMCLKVEAQRARAA